MRVGGRALGLSIIVVIVLLVWLSVSYTDTLTEQRTEAIERLQSLPPEAECTYEDPSLCPQAEEHIVVPNLTGIGLAVLGILLGLYLFRSDGTQRRILEELQSKRRQLSVDERKELVFSVLTVDEKKILSAVQAQPGITQATLRLRTGLSKPKLSNLLKELEKRGLVEKQGKGKTNTVHLKMRWG